MSALRKQIHTHPSSGESVLPTLQRALPYSLPLLGRLKFHHRSPASQVFASFPGPSDPVHRDDISVQVCYAVAFLDRTRRPETECWIFASGEIPGRCSLSSSSKHCDECTAAIIALLNAIAWSDLPESIHELETMSRSHPALERSLKGEVLLLGAVHEACAKIIKEAIAGADAEAPAAGIDDPYLKHLFRPDTLPEAQDLPAGLRWGQVRREDFALVRSRTSIPRQDPTLALLPSLAIFREHEPNASPVAWAFLGVNGSLTSLHTEQEFRGKGLAKMLTGKLFREGGLDDETWFHADVALDNGSSRGVCRALGGEEAWIVYWIRIDLKEFKGS